MLGRGGLWRAALALTLAFGGAAAAATPCPTITVFSRADCPHCAEAARFLEDLRARRPGLEVTVRDVQRDAGALTALRALAARHGVAPIGVPAFEICGTFLVGFGDAATTGRRIESLVTGAELEALPPTTLDLPLVGPVSLEALGLPLFTLALGLADGFNPCAMWVLLFLLSVLVGVRDRRRVALVAGTFVLTSGVAYYAFLAAWLELFVRVGLSRAAQVTLALVALAIGAVHLKDFLAPGVGVSLSIPDAAKPTLYARLRRLVRAESLPAALAGAFVLAVLVNAVELLCTAGIPALYTQVLVLQSLPAWQHYAYLALYDVAYLLDDGVLVAIAVVTLRGQRLQERGGRWLKLVSGLVVAVLGALLLLAPGWLAGLSSGWR
jgi:glutaredoxin